MADTMMLEGKLDVSTVPALHAALLKRADQDVVLDLSEVTHIGALCVQTCLAAARHAQEAGTSFRLTNVPDGVLAQLSCMGFSPETLSEGRL